MEIKCVEDLRKLVGWHIKDIAIITDSSDPIVKLTLSQIAADFLLQVEIKPVVTFGRSGNVFLVNASLNVKAEERYANTQTT